MLHMASNDTSSESQGAILKRGSTSGRRIRSFCLCRWGEYRASVEALLQAQSFKYNAFKIRPDFATMRVALKSCEELPDMTGNQGLLGGALLS